MTTGTSPFKRRYTWCLDLVWCVPVLAFFISETAPPFDAFDYALAVALLALGLFYLVRAKWLAKVHLGPPPRWSW